MTYNVLNDEQLSDSGIWRFSLKCVVPVRGRCWIQRKLVFLMYSSEFSLIFRWMVLSVQNSGDLSRRTHKRSKCGGCQ